MKHNNKIFSFIMIAVLFVTAFAIAVPTQTAAAGNKGQQIEVQSYASSTVVITGYNQNGRKVTWQGRTATSGKHKTTGWWWVGRVEIQVYAPMGNMPLCYTNVITTQKSDWVYVTCR